MDDIIRILADELGKKPEHIENVIKLIDRARMCRSRKRSV